MSRNVEVLLLSITARGWLVSALSQYARNKWTATLRKPGTLRIAYGNGETAGEALSKAIRMMPIERVRLKR